MSDPDIVVLRQKIHGMDAEGYAAALRERLPEKEIVLASTPEEERELLQQTSIATGLQIDPDILPDTDLELFACVYAGTSHLPIDELTEHGVAVTSAAGVHGPNVAEHIVGNILTFSRRFDQAWRQKERREWRSYPPRELKGSTVAIVGLGAIGQEAVDRLEPFDVHTVGVRYSPEKGGPTDEVYGFDQVHEAVQDAEYVVVVCPLTDTTEGLFDASVFRTMPADSILINVGRGPIVDTDALIDALRSNAIGGAALDVTDPEPLPEDHELWGFDNVFITPHNAGATPKYWDRLADILSRNVEQAEERGFENLENQVN